MQGGWKIEINVFQNLRGDLDKRVTTYLPSPQAQLLSGILLGQNQQLPGQFRLALRDTSTLHIVVASGQNLSMVAGFFFLLAGLIKRRTAILLSFMAVIFYVCLTGAQVPILRAAIMVLAGYWTQIMGREKDSIWIVVVTAGLMLLINPEWITDLSFQLSFLATLGVIGVAPIFLRLFRVLPQFIKGDLSVSLAAQALVMPVIGQNFHQLSLVALPTNLLVLWTVPFIMILGTIFLLLSFLIPPVAVVFGLVLNLLLTYFIYIVQFFASLPFAWEYVGEFSWLVWVGYYLVVAALLLFIRRLDT